ncbi:MAG TPA: phosphopantetheine-binding protein [Candidatus Krumholzibacteria bacterium]|nr:phosphopantetheine-binding protein [Candidatus Krumholzibacteria bacterium]
MSPHEDLIAAFVTWSPSLAENVARDTPLLTSGRLDSMAVFQLLMWIEERLGHTLDVTVIDMPAQWNTVNDIIAFVEKARRE